MKHKSVCLFVLMIFISAELTVCVNNMEIHDKLLGHFYNDSMFTFRLSQTISDLIHFHYKQKCVTIIKDNKSEYEFFVVEFHDLAVAIMQIEGNDNDTNNLQNYYENQCDWFIVQTANPKWFINAVVDLLKISYHRENPRITFLSNVLNIDENNDFDLEIFNLTTNIFPDVLVICIDHNISGSILHFKTGDWITGQSSTLYSCSLDECKVTEMELFPDKITDLNGKQLRGAALQYPPFAVIYPKPDGAEFKLYEEYARIHNSTLKVETEYGFWGEIWENKTGNGVAGRVYRGDADFGFGALYLWYHIHHHLDFTSAYSRSGVTCLVPRAHQVSSWLLPFLPFDATLWTLVLSTLAVAAVTLYYTAKVANQFSSNWKQRFRTISDSVLRVIGLLVMQVPTAKGIRPPPLPLRYIITLLEVMFILVVTSYHSGLATTLTLRRYERPIESVQDLVDSGLPWGNVHDAWIFSILLTQEKNTKILLHRYQATNASILAERVKKQDYAVCLERLESGFFAVGDFITDESVSGIQLMKEDIYYEYVVGVMPKASPYRKSLNTLISRVHNGGLVLSWEREMAGRYLSPVVQNGIAHNHVISNNIEPTGLQMEQFLGNLVILAIGHSVALITFIIEVFWYKWKVKELLVSLFHGITT